MLDSVVFVGLLRGLIGLPLEHPFDVVKTKIQSQSCSPWTAMSSIWKTDGVRGFYRGLYANGTTMVVKHTWRQPVYLLTTERLGQQYGYGALNGVLTAPIMAVSESLLLTLPDRLKVWVITAKKDPSLGAYFREVQGRDFFKGFTLLFQKKIVSWVVWDTASKGSRSVYSTATGRNNLNFGEQLFLGFFSSLATLSVTYPIDTIKTRFQSQGQQESLANIGRQVYRTHGFRSFYRGLSIVLVHYTLHDALQGTLRSWFAAE